MIVETFEIKCLKMKKKKCYSLWDLRKQIFNLNTFVFEWGGNILIDLIYHFSKKFKKSFCIKIIDLIFFAKIFILKKNML